MFYTAEQAIAAHFRPCKRCKPTGQRLPDEEWIALVTEYIERHYADSLSLNTLANISHGTPYHLHRTFRRITGITPVDYIQQVRINHAKRQLRTTDLSVAHIGESVGLRNTPYFVTLFKKMTDLTPDAYRRHDKP
ncbi:hypothetical protein PCCS19_04650 [Paenibacillus sp. CCS19]|nr:hypothetical protein PCCS19_04650 [Paenibacillus cellulosilyticus]